LVVSKLESPLLNEPSPDGGVIDQVSVESIELQPDKGTDGGLFSRISLLIFTVIVGALQDFTVGERLSPFKGFSLNVCPHGPDEPLPFDGPEFKSEGKDG